MSATLTKSRRCPMQHAYTHIPRNIYTHTHTHAHVTYPELLPSDVACAKETRDLIIECCVGPSKHLILQSLFLGKLMIPTLPAFPFPVDRHSFSLPSFLEFIHLISSEANEICEQDSKKTIAPEHIIGALKVCLHFFLAPSPLAPIGTPIIDFDDRIPEARFRIIHRGGRRRSQGP